MFCGAARYDAEPRTDGPPVPLRLLPLLDDLLQLALESLYGPLRGDVAGERSVVLLRQFQGHVRVVRRDGPRRGVLYDGLLAEAALMKKFQPPSVLKLGFPPLTGIGAMST